MEVILLENVRNLGKIGTRVGVKAGYARNFLIPFGKAMVVNSANIAKFENQQVELEKKAAEVLAKARERAEKITSLNLIIPVKATEDGKLFGSVGISAIIEAFKALGTVVNKSEISLPQGVIRNLGTHEIILTLHSEVSLKVNVCVVNAD